jgi:K+-transporting ATPase ATPase A chain
MARVYQGQRVALAPLLGPGERLLYRLLGIDPSEQQDWKQYARSMLIFSLFSWLALYLLLRSQSVHPWNPSGFGAGPWDLSFNTASSFVSNTSWQYYGGETTLSYFSQMAGIAVASFTSAAVGISVAIALIRGIARRESELLGNFWADLVRSLIYVLLPLSVVGGLVLGAGGVIQTLGGPVATGGVMGAKTLALGPVASQEAIKLLSGDGGGFFNVNSAMPFENPTASTNFVEILLMLLIPAALTYTFGRMVGRRRQGWALFAVMLSVFVVGVGVLYAAEVDGSPAIHAAGAEGPNLEGKEQRFEAAGSSLFVAASTAGGDGAVNAALDSFTGLGGAVPMFNIMTGEVVFGGPGSGLYSMLMLVLLAVFLGGLMVGRTPEYLGKKIEAREMKLVIIGTIVLPLLVLSFTALAVATPWGQPSIFNPKPQGFSESLYAYLSQANNNGSAFAGYTGFVQPNAPGNAGSYTITFANLMGGLAMLLGRFVPMLVALALAGSLGAKRVAPAGLGTLRTDTASFAALLIFVVVLIAVLNFFPALMLGPVVQSQTHALF